MIHRLACVAGAVAVLAMAGCAAGPQGSAVFKEAYWTACRQAMDDAGGYFNGTPRGRDEDLYAADEDYRDGWNQGYAECYDHWLVKPVGEGGSTF